jgi:CheY-like chemotaxis protein
MFEGAREVMSSTEQTQKIEQQDGSEENSDVDIQMTLLFVDDFPSFLELAERYFETSEHSFTVRTCEDPEKAVEMVEEESIDCIISDYQMAEMNGLKLLQKVRQREPDMPFLLLTSKGSEEVASEAITKGATDYINKGGSDKYELVVQRAKNAVLRARKDKELNKRLRQQQVTAELGQKALGDVDLDCLMHEASKYVAEVLGNDYCKVLDLQPDGDELLLRQGVGWKEGMVGEATVKAAKEENSQASYTLLSEEPVIVSDMDKENRFEGPELLTSHDVKSGISTIIGHPDKPWGILGTHHTEKKEFDRYDVEFVQNIANILANAIDRKNREEKTAERKKRIDELEDLVSKELMPAVSDTRNHIQAAKETQSEDDIESAEESIRKVERIIDSKIRDSEK